MTITAATSIVVCVLSLSMDAIATARVRAQVREIVCEERVDVRREPLCGCGGVCGCALHFQHVHC